MTEGHRTPRSYCPTPDCCSAPKRGVCLCQVDEILRQRMSAARKKAWADPEVRQRMSAASKKALADPEVRQRMSAARKKAWADPEVRQRMSAASKKALAAKRIPVPDHLKSYAAKLRRNGIRGEALRIALESAT